MPDSSSHPPSAPPHTSRTTPAQPRSVASALAQLATCAHPPATCISFDVRVGPERDARVFWCAGCGALATVSDPSDLSGGRAWTQPALAAACTRDLLADFGELLSRVATLPLLLGPVERHDAAALAELRLALREMASSPVVTDAPRLDEAVEALSTPAGR